MAKLVLDLAKNVEHNASMYFEKAKKIKKKIGGAERALQESLKELRELEARKEKELRKSEEAIEKKKAAVKKEWYEKFRWFKSSDELLVIGGRDATTNEIIIKKHTDSNDLVFHTDIAGSPFFVVKSEGKEIGNQTMQETADATCTYSRAWKLGLQTTPVFHVKPEQVSKKMQSGEYMGKGAFMIYGKANYVDNKINLAIGITNEGKIMAGPLEAVKAHCGKLIELVQGNEKVSAIAKLIKHRIGGEIDDIIRALPAGEFSVKK